MKIKVLITAKKGHPIAVISGAERCSCRIHKSRARSMKRDESGAIILPADYWYEFVALNLKHFELEYVSDVEIDKASIPYYGFESGNKRMYRTRLTEKFVEDFFNYDASRIVRYEPNTEGALSVMGIREAEFSTVIFENLYCGTKIDEDTTIEECEQIRKGCHPNSNAYKALTNHMQVVKGGINVDEVMREVEEYEKNLNEIFAQYADEITEYIKTLPERPLDCGFTFVHTSDEHMKSCYQMLVSFGKRESNTVNVEFPDNYFCCSQSHAILEKLKKLSNNPIMNTIWVQTMLD